MRCEIKSATAPIALARSLLPRARALSLALALALSLSRALSLPPSFSHSPGIAARPDGVIIVGHLSFEPWTAHARQTRELWLDRRPIPGIWRQCGEGNNIVVVSGAFGCSGAMWLFGLVVGFSVTVHEVPHFEAETTRTSDN